MTVGMESGWLFGRRVASSVQQKDDDGVKAAIESCKMLNTVERRGERVGRG